MNNILHKIDQLVKEERLELPVFEFIRFINTQEQCSDTILTTGAALMHYHLNGHICISETDINDFSNELGLPEISNKELHSKVENSLVLGNGKRKTPIVLENGKVYLHRFWAYENELVDWLLNKSNEHNSITEEKRTAINSLFPYSKDGKDWQKLAVTLSHLKKLLVITGGPGTGKTYTIQKMLESHLMDSSKTRIALCAPTGKAAQRLNESIESEIIQTYVNPATTIHSLLGAKGVTGKFKYGINNSLPYDIIIVDEASMLDLNLWISLIRAVPDNALVVLLGDKNQLASVEAGSILGDICSGASNMFSMQLSEALALESSEIIEPSLNDSIIELTENHRFENQSGINKLSEAIIRGNVEEAHSILTNEAHPDVRLVEASNESITQMIQNYVTHPFKAMKDKGFSHDRFKEYQIICALRKGPYGVEYLNRSVELELKKEIGVSASLEWYPGRLIIATKNNYILKLRNGETGYVLPNSNNQSYEISFEGKEEPVNNSRIIEYEPGYCLTAHKSQGSEFDHVVLVLSNNESSILTKELLYTAVTRARKSLLILSAESVFTYSIKRRVVRRSGIDSKIWN